MTDTDLRRALTAYRERVLYADREPRDRRRGLLRRAMIDHLIEWKPTTTREWLAELPSDLAAQTDPREFRQHAEAVMSILRRQAGLPRLRLVRR